VSAGRTAYVADLGNHVIQAISAAGVATTFCGSPGAPGFVDGGGTFARFNNPHMAAMDPSGAIALYVGDMGNAAIRRVQIATATVTTVTGVGPPLGSSMVTPTVKFGQPKGVAVSPDGSTLYVVDFVGRCIRGVGLLSGLVRNVAGACTGLATSVDGVGSAASFTNLESLSVDARGVLWVADNLLVRTVTPTGVVSTVAAARSVAGAPPSSFLGAAQYAVANTSAGVLVDSSGRAVYALACAACAPGAFCSGGVTTLCPAGTYNALSGATAAAACLACAAAPGSFCGVGTVSPAGSVCAIGWSCAGGTAPPSVCTCAAACPVAGLAAPVALCGIACNVTTLFGVAGFGGAGLVNGTLAVARLRIPRIVAVVASGLVISEDGGLQTNTYGSVTASFVGNNDLRAVALPSGVVSTVAGSPTAGYADGVGGALFNRPLGLACRADSTCYVADLMNQRVRTVSPTGSVSVLAGSGAAGATDGIGAAALFSSPHALTLDPSGATLYVSEVGTSRVRRVVIATQAVSVLAGSSAGLVDGPALTAKFSGNKGLAVTPDGLLLYVCDTANRLVRVVTLSPPGSEQVTTFAGSAAAASLVDGAATSVGLFGPESVAVDSKGAVYVADVVVLRRIVSSPTGAFVTVVAGSGARLATDGVVSAFAFASSVAVLSETAATTKLVIVDNFANTLRTATCGACYAGFYCVGGAALPCPAGTWSAATGLTSAAQCAACTAAPGAACLPGSTAPTGSACPSGFWCAGGAAPASPCTCVAACAAGGLALEPASAWSVSTVSGSGAAGLVNGGPAASQYNSPLGLAVMPDGSLLVADYLSNVVRAISSSGLSTTLSGTGVQSAVDGPVSLATFNHPGAVIPWLNPPAPSGLALVLDTGATTLRGLYANGSVATLYGGLQNAAGLAQDPNTGAIYVADQAHHTIVLLPNLVGAPVVTFAGTLNTPAFADGPSGTNRFNFPTSVAVSAEAPGSPLAIYVADKTNARVRAIVRRARRPRGSGPSQPPTP